MITELNPSRRRFMSRLGLAVAAGIIDIPFKCHDINWPGTFKICIFHTVAAEREVLPKFAGWPMRIDRAAPFDSGDDLQIIHPDVRHLHIGMYGITDREHVFQVIHIPNGSVAILRFHFKPGDWGTEQYSL